MTHLNKDLNPTRERVFTLRDLTAYCARCVVSTPVERETLFLEAVNVFCNHLAASNQRRQRADMFAHILNIGIAQVRSSVHRQENMSSC